MMDWGNVKALSDMLSNASKLQEEREIADEKKRQEDFLLEHEEKIAEAKKKAEEAEKVNQEIAKELDKLKNDRRNKPEYEFSYKQAVTSNDVYLHHMSEKDPGSSSCEHLVMRINLPNTESMGDLKLDLKATYMKLLSPIYALGIFLPQRVDPEKSDAKWDYETSALEITMYIDRDGKQDSANNSKTHSDS